MNNPAIIIIAFNRPQSLSRLLASVSKAEYPADKEVPLCICIDYQDSPANREVVQIADSFLWSYGPKEVVCQKRNLGLKAHVLKCGDLTEKYGGVIVLEDDLFVSPGYYGYAIAAIEYYQDNSKIGGVSLYNHKLNFSNQLPFTPIQDGTDVYFLRLASSWGQVWTRDQWSRFRSWFSKNSLIPETAPIPRYIINWPESSWLKHFILFLESTDSYFVFPRTSLSTNFGDKGQNNGTANTYFQVPLLESKNTAYSFISLEKSLAVYDSFFDLTPEVLKKVSPDLQPYDFCNNLSSLKSVDSIGEEYVLISNISDNAVIEYGMQLKPLESNIFNDIKGKGLSLIPIKEARNSCFNEGFSERRLKFKYYYGLIGVRKQVQTLFDLILSRIIK